MKPSAQSPLSFERNPCLKSAELVTPFGMMVQLFLSQRSLTQKALSRSLGMGQSYLSAILCGKKGEPQASIIHGISVALQLSPIEKNELIWAAELSATRFEIRDLSMWKYALAAKFMQKLTTLPPELGAIIDATLSVEDRRTLFMSTSPLTEKDSPT